MAANRHLPLLAVFVCPLLSENACRMIEAAASLPGVRIGVVSQDPQEHAPSWARLAIAAHWRVDSILDVDQLVGAVRGIESQMGMPVQRLFGAYEQAQQPIADARQALAIPGLSSAATRNFRDKARMKDVLRAAGLPCARHVLAASVDDALRGARAIGYPLVVKPPRARAPWPRFAWNGTRSCWRYWPGASRRRRSRRSSRSSSRVTSTRWKRSRSAGVQSGIRSPTMRRPRWTRYGTRRRQRRVRRDGLAQ